MHWGRTSATMASVSRQLRQGSGQSIQGSRRSRQSWPTFAQRQGPGFARSMNSLLKSRISSFTTATVSNASRQNDKQRSVLEVHVTHTGGAAEVRVEGEGLTTPAPVVADAADGTVEVPVAVSRPVVGEQRSARVLAGDAQTPFEFTVAEPGWTMHMISHFHYDPVWWNTQAAYTSVWSEDPPGRCRQTNGFELVRAHLEMARREPEYKFVLAEIDYLKPYWDTHPEDREDLRRFIADGRVEVMGGAYNEPNTNLTGPETTIRNFVHGMGFQRDILGADPGTAWQLDVFGHDPQFPGMAADGGLTS